jgi:hypothetical protein
MGNDPAAPTPRFVNIPWYIFAGVRALIRKSANDSSFHSSIYIQTQQLGGNLRHTHTPFFFISKFSESN